jgi:hypothetical protein
MYVSPISPLFTSGISTPAILAILTLSLFKLRVLFIDHIELSFSSDYFAIDTSLFY